jgi:hypothetical protein
MWTYRFLVEVWVEPREVPGLPLLVRARVHDLEQNEPRYVGSMAEIEEIINQRLDGAGLVPRRWESDL